MGALNEKADRLVQEFRGNLGLDEHDALRAAFVVFAYCRGYSKARIGRFQGISRARIEQKVSKYRQYAADAESWPVLAEVMPATPVPSTNGHREVAVEFNLEDWSNADFAVEMVNRVV